MIHKPIKAVLFDLDGTLIDSEQFYYSNWAPVLETSFAVQITYEDWIRDFAGHTLSQVLVYMKERYQIETTEEFMKAATRANYAKSDMRNIPLMPFAKEILILLKQNNIKVGLVTSSYQATVDTVLGHHGLLDYFEFFVTREQVINAKPNAEPYLLGIQKMGIAKDEIVAVEDTITGATAAKNAGLYCIAVSKHPSEQSKLTNQVNLLLNSLEEALEYLSIDKKYS